MWVSSKLLSIDCGFGSLSWTKTVRFGTILAEFQERQYAEFWGMTEDDYNSILDETIAWVELLPERQDTEEQLQPYLDVSLLQMPL